MCKLLQLQAWFFSLSILPQTDNILFSQEINTYEFSNNYIAQQCVISFNYDHYHLYQQAKKKMRLQRLKTQKNAVVRGISDQQLKNKTVFFPDIAMTNRNIKSDDNGLSYLYREIQKKRTIDPYEKRAQLGSNFKNNFRRHKSTLKTQSRKQPTKLTHNDISLYKANLQQINKKRSLLKSVAWNSFIGSKLRNQDRVFLNLDFQFSGKLYPFFAIFDGHGGSSTSQFLYNNTFKMFQKNVKLGYSVKQSLQKCIQQAEQRLKNLYELNKKEKSGSCALICVFDCDQLYISNIGDSRAITINSKGKVKQLTTDHKPQNERERIEKEGGKLYRVQKENGQPIGPYRVWPAKLSVSRTIGDISIKNQDFGSSISSIPQIFCYPINGGSRIILMSDGVYECLTNDQIGFYFEKSKNIAQAINKTILSAIQKGSTDNISILAIQIS